MVGIFYLISLIALWVYKKEGMGFGDVKLMAALGLFFGAKNILVVTLISFFIGAVIGGILLILKKKESQSYMAFGPFIVIGAILIMYIKPKFFVDLYLGLCMGISNVITNLLH